MRRRTILQWAAAAAGTLPFPLLRAWAQTANFPGNQQATMRKLAALVLPAELGRAGTDRIADQFERWVREYRAGAAMEHGYGFPRLRAKAASPAATYIGQLETLSASVGGTTARSAIESSLDAASIKDLPRQPDGRNIVADLMSFYFHGSDANDLCYRAEIQREECRGLKGSDNPPPPLRGAQ